MGYSVNMSFNLVLSCLHSTLGVNDSTFLLDKVAEPDGSEVAVEEPVVEGLKADGLTRDQVADIDPVVEPADAAVTTDAPNHEVFGIGDGSSTSAVP
jgi:hypothetical protein